MCSGAHAVVVNAFWLTTPTTEVQRSMQARRVRAFSWRLFGTHETATHLQTASHTDDATIE